MATKRNVDLITEAFADVMTARRKYELKNPDGSLLKEIFLIENLTITKSVIIYLSQ